MKKLSIFSWYCYPIPIEERLKAVKETGFEATMLWWGSEDKYIQPYLARKIGLEIENIHAPFKNANSFWFDREDGENYLNLLMDCVKDCTRYSIPTIVIHITGFSDPPDISQIGIDRVEKLVDLAEKEGINLAFENLNFLQHINYIFENFKSNRVKFCYDSGHENWNHPDANCLSKYGNRLEALHLNDNFGNADTHLLPYDGNINWKKVKSDLLNRQNIKYISLEIDFNSSAKESEIYKNLSGLEFLQKAFEKATMIL